MIFRILIFLIFNYIFLQTTNCESCDLDDVYVHLFGQVENVKRSLEILNTRLDIVYDRHSSIVDKNEIPEKSHKTSKSIFDIRIDAMPKHCPKNHQPSSCAEATECTRSSGIYNITDTRYSNQTFTVYCDNESYDGNWLYILRRQDGSEPFNRTWNDYVKGFGNVAGEYWVGLEKLYALTNFYGPQELNVYIENFEGVTKFARYDNFAIDNAIENYKLKTLGRYWGTAGDDMYSNLGQQFSTYDKDNDAWSRNCATELGKGGFWFEGCTDANPTGIYLRGIYSDGVKGCFWRAFGGIKYSHKTIIFMIRRKIAGKLD